MTFMLDLWRGRVSDHAITEVNVNSIYFLHSPMLAMAR